jgi:hypothetical protein
MSDLITTWRRSITAVQLRPGTAPTLVDVEPLELFSVLGRPGDAFLRHLVLDEGRLLIATDVHTSGALAIPTPGYPENAAATGLLRASVDLQGFAIVGTVYLVGVDAAGKPQDVPAETLTKLSELGHPVPTEMRITP